MDPKIIDLLRKRDRHLSTDQFNEVLDSLFDFKRCTNPRCGRTSRHYVIEDGGLCARCTENEVTVGRMEREQEREEIMQEKVYSSDFGAFS